MIRWGQDGIGLRSQRCYIDLPVHPFEAESTARRRDPTIDRWQRCPWIECRELNDEEVPYKHIGLYVYSRDFLLAFTRLSQTPLEISERLEQLRVLEMGYKIKVVETEFDTVGIDIPEDLKKAEELLGQN